MRHTDTPANKHNEAGAPEFRVCNFLRSFLLIFKHFLLCPHKFGAHLFKEILDGRKIAGNNATAVEKA